MGSSRPNINLVNQHFSIDKIITIFDEMRATKLYSALKALPKGVLHHVHFDCCEDEEFVKNIFMIIVFLAYCL